MPRPGALLRPPIVDAPSDVHIYVDLPAPRRRARTADASAGAPGELKAGYPLAAHPAGNGNGERGPASSASVPTAGGRNPEQQQFDEGGPKTGPRPPVAGRLRLK
jgi:hypothetical protein